MEIPPFFFQSTTYRQHVNTRNSKSLPLTHVEEDTQQTDQPITVNDTEKQTVIRLQFRLVLSFQRTEIKLWQWCVLTSPKRNLGLSVRAHLCVRVSLRVAVCVCGLFIWWWITQLWGSRLASFYHANSHWSLPPLSLNPSLPALHLPAVTRKNTLNSTKTSTFQDLE